MTVHRGDCVDVMAGMAGMAGMEPATVQLVVTSPPYFNIKDYSMDGR